MNNPSPEAITAASGSNLALAFISLSPERRKDMNLFYAFCRVVDDIADDPGTSVADKRSELDAWKAALQNDAAMPSLAPAMRDLMKRYPVPVDLLLEIIQGVAMDLDTNRYATFEELRVYCHRVASVVGLVSIEIFGYKNEACKAYAEALGLALQLTNILRDVAVDLKNGDRIYLPLEDLERFELTPRSLHDGPDQERFQALMRFQAERAQSYYEKAVTLLPKEDRRTMVAAEIMRRVYHRLLVKMQRDDFRVFDKTYRLGKPEKLWLILKTMWLG